MNHGRHWGAIEQLLGWAIEQDLRFDTDTVDGAERWAARLETYLTDPRVATDPSRFETGPAFLPAD